MKATKDMISKVMDRLLERIMFEFETPTGCTKATQLLYDEAILDRIEELIHKLRSLRKEYKKAPEALLFDE